MPFLLFISYAKVKKILKSNHICQSYHNRKSDLFFVVQVCTVSHKSIEILSTYWPKLTEFHFLLIYYLYDICNKTIMKDLTVS